ncbi:Peptidyl-lysine N-acetyltransferase YiaC [Methanimicrococcus sp. At1]|uniref:Peptidyl-lysine N-acetyltransferase YiaC n=1 Tax=Methanimicrococcus hacksteinii TaxID=3028293 RepID=A0ABU3VQI9_9EURY|nr:GNAT family N-acetyltransferase [Methanimicrococcus sp. At1]MDV0445680.1 Peptidyl-lysine N-acetyltransferase YiaC [Methanimicrococcus sp. At1]
MRDILPLMIEKADPDKTNEMNEIAELWLKTNLTGQDFIPETYWKSRFEDVKKMLPEADIYVFKEKSKIYGFIGIVENRYVAGLFTDYKSQGKGIGKSLIEFCQKEYDYLELDVYVKNIRAVSFYLKNGFVIDFEKTDDETNEREYRMSWKKEK